MKKIVLLGDSIRLGYEKYVAEALSGVAEVYSPKENCRYALNLLRFAHEWAKDWPREEIELVHWNAGLWDALHLLGDEALMPLDAYERIIPRIHARLRSLFPKAKLVFATSTSVDMARQRAGFGRDNAEIMEYNAAAVAALSGLDSEINDLYAVSIALPPEAHSDPTHYNTKLGCKGLGDAVLAVACPHLGIGRADLSPISGELPDIPESILGF